MPEAQPNDYYYNPQVGFVSVNQTLQANDVLAVAYQYSYNGRIYQVGEFAQDVPPIRRWEGARRTESAVPEIAEATSQRTNLPLWD